MVFGLFDYLVLVVMIYLNYRNWNKGNIETYKGCGISLLVIGFMLPTISAFVEVKIAPADWGMEDEHDTFEIAYVYLKYPIYWGIGIVQSVFFAIVNYKNKRKDKTK